MPVGACRGQRRCLPDPSTSWTPRRCPDPGSAFDFREGADTVTFSWSPDGWSWQVLGAPEPLTFDLRYFVGTRAALFCYGGGSACFRNFEAEVLE